LKKLLDKSLLLQDQKSNCWFKIREDMELGLSVTLRGEKCMPFNKIIIFTFAQIRDFVVYL
jgi:ribosomal protein L5